MPLTAVIFAPASLKGQTIPPGTYARVPKGPAPRVVVSCPSCGSIGRLPAGAKIDRKTGEVDTPVECGGCIFAGPIRLDHWAARK